MRFSRVLSFGAALCLTLAAGCGQEEGVPRQEEAVAGGGVADDVDLPSIISYRNASDPDARVIDGELWLFTSSDLWNNDGSLFPMDTTYSYYLDSSSVSNPGNPADWRDPPSVTQTNIPAFTEADLAAGAGWGDGAHKHLWAPAAIRWSGDEKVTLYVPDTEKADPNSSSNIFVAQSGMDLLDEYSYVERLHTYYDNPVSDYASDPSPAEGPDGERYLVFANGYGQNCGGLSLATLGDDDATFASVVKEIHVTSLPGGVDDTLVCDANHSPKCNPKDSKKTNWTPRCPGDHNSPNGQYLEGASLYYIPSRDNFQTAGPWYLVFPRKPKTGNQIISYATAETLDWDSSQQVHFKYRGDLMAGSSTSWTNQASMALYRNQWLLFYHDGPSTAYHQRKTHMECLRFSSDGLIAKVARTTQAAGDADHESSLYCARPPLHWLRIYFRGTNTGSIVTVNPGKARCKVANTSYCNQWYGAGQDGSGTALTLVGYCQGVFNGWGGVNNVNPCDSTSNSVDGSTHSCKLKVGGTSPSKAVYFNCDKRK